MFTSLLLLATLSSAEAGRTTPLQSAELSNTAFTPDKGDVYIQPMKGLTIGVTDTLSLQTTPLLWTLGPQLSAELGLIENQRYAVSISPYFSSNYELEDRTMAMDLNYSHKMGKQQLNTTVRLGHEQEDGYFVPVMVSYDISPNRKSTHRIKGQVDAMGFVEDYSSWSAGYSYNRALTKRFRIEVGADIGRPTSVTGQLFDEEGLRSSEFIPAPNLSMWWTF